jgi:dethiobiotin synthetase
MRRIVFITGTDTGVGKTLVTALLLLHLRGHGCHALAMKPFSSGGLGDAQLLFRAQEGEIPLETISPFQFPQPVAPLVAARRSGRRITRAQVAEKILALAERCELLLVEGAGGLFVPIGDQSTVADLVEALQSPVVLVARNRLGVVNHTLLTLECLRRRRVPHIRIVLSDGPSQDPSSSTNSAIIEEFAAAGPVARLSYLGPGLRRIARLRATVNSQKKVLQHLADGVFSPPLFDEPRAKKG